MEWERFLTGLLITAGIPAAGYIIGEAACALHRVVQKLTADAKKSERQLACIAFETADRVLEAVTKATIGKLESTSAAELREKVKAGESEFAELKALSGVALQEILRQLQPDVRAALLSGISDLNAHISSRIEAALPEVKAEYAEACAARAGAMQELEWVKQDHVTVPAEVNTNEAARPV